MSASGDFDAGLLEYEPSRVNLRREFERLQAVSDARAPEAVVFYAARILEGVAADALEHLTLEPSPNCFSNLELLDRFDKLTTSTRYWSHSLRRLGNAVRHLLHDVTEADSVLAILFVELWVDWFLARILKRPRAFGDAATACKVKTQLRGLANCLERTDLHLDDASLLEPMLEDPSFWMSPVFSAALSEVLLGKGVEFQDHADDLLGRSIDRFPRDFRLRQLLGLSFSRKGRYPEAIRVLEELASESPRDEETIGILAGVHKRRYLADPADRDALALAHKMYRAGWKNSKEINSYLGINAATTALLGGVQVDAERLAVAVESTLRKRLGPTHEHLKPGFWERATLAEALFVQQKWDAAEAAYRDAFAHGVGRPGEVESAKSQRSSILDAFRRLGIEPPDA